MTIIQILDVSFPILSPAAVKQVLAGSFRLTFLAACRLYRVLEKVKVKVYFRRPFANSLVFVQRGCRVVHLVQQMCKCMLVVKELQVMICCMLSILTSGDRN